MTTVHNYGKCIYSSWFKHIDSDTYSTHHQVSYDHDHEENHKAHACSGNLHTVPHGFNPFPTQDAKDNEKRMEKIIHVPAGQITVLCYFTHAVLVAFAKELHSHNCKDEDNDGQHQSQVPQSTH